ncbi:uncharacterized protein HMPREF1541_08922 [Cyphellophora europaea CBS 101466]|uniref:Uncharacterized protein n=1 Tax=Cyphellophora europaea (strain CBS 101466) TaxID=1220924 RepID=W2RLN1_CYPE1|nr:uncharacterized protein HMPREF1541_08922 [Cyphellophora europaea CBS 101466]ETN36644.1 hypothetical protein HMPREF1541_08922 [Cyphellophora europaea CBS 101466]
MLEEIYESQVVKRGLKKDGKLGTNTQASGGAVSINAKKEAGVGEQSIKNVQDKLAPDVVATIAAGVQKLEIADDKAKEVERRAEQKTQGKNAPAVADATDSSKTEGKYDKAKKTPSADKVKQGGRITNKSGFASSVMVKVWLAEDA